MPELVSVQIKNSSGQAAGFAYYNRRKDGSAGNKYYGSGAEKRSYGVKDTNTGMIRGTSASKMTKTIKTSGPRQLSRTARVFKNVNAAR